MIDSNRNPPVSPKLPSETGDKLEGASSWLGRTLARKPSTKSVQSNYRHGQPQAHNKENAAGGLLGDSLGTALTVATPSSWRSRQGYNQNNRRFGEGHSPPNLNLQPIPQYVEDAAPSPAISFNKDFECAIPDEQDFFSLPYSPGSPLSSPMAYEVGITSPSSIARTMDCELGPATPSADDPETIIQEPSVQTASKTLQSTLSSEPDALRQMSSTSSGTALALRSQNPSRQQSQPLQKEKGGFFRKFFSGNSKTPTATTARACSTSVAQSRYTGTKHFTERSPSYSQAIWSTGFVSSPPRPKPERQGDQNVLAKKPSGFFKKRKKSIPTSPVPHNPAASSWNAAAFPAPDASPVPPVHFLSERKNSQPASVNSESQRRQSQSTGMPTTKEEDTKQNATTKPRTLWDSDAQVDMSQAHGHEEVSSPEDLSKLAKADGVIAHIMERASDSTTSFEKSMRNYLVGVECKDLPEEMTRMRSLTTGSEGDLNLASIDKQLHAPDAPNTSPKTSSDDPDTSDKVQGDKRPQSPTSPRPLVERRWTDQQESQHLQQSEDQLPRRTSHSQLQATTATDSSLKVVSSGSTHTTSALTFTSPSSKGASPKPDTERARSMRSVRSHRSLLGDYMASARAGLANFAGIKLPEEGSGKPRVSPTPSLKPILFMPGASPLGTGSFLEEFEGTSADFGVEAGANETDGGKAPESNRQDTSAEKHTTGEKTVEGETTEKDHDDQQPSTSPQLSPGFSDTNLAEDHDLARRLFETDDPHCIDKITNYEPVVAWLSAPSRSNVRRAYMQNFNWTNLNIVNALRSLCSRIPLKGEGQQVDRVLESFSSRWCECNPNHLFKSTG